MTGSGRQGGGLGRLARAPCACLLPACYWHAWLCTACLPYICIAIACVKSSSVAMCVSHMSSPLPATLPCAAAACPTPTLPTYPPSPPYSPFAPCFVADGQDSQWRSGRGWWWWWWHVLASRLLSLSLILYLCCTHACLPALPYLTIHMLYSVAHHRHHHQSMNMMMLIDLVRSVGRTTA